MGIMQHVDVYLWDLSILHSHQLRLQQRHVEPKGSHGRVGDTPLCDYTFTRRAMVGPPENRRMEYTQTVVDYIAVSESKIGDVVKATVGEHSPSTALLLSTCVVNGHHVMEMATRVTSDLQGAPAAVRPGVVLRPNLKKLSTKEGGDGFKAALDKEILGLINDRGGGGCERAYGGVRASVMEQELKTAISKAIASSIGYTKTGGYKGGDGKAKAWVTPGLKKALGILNKKITRLVKGRKKKNHSAARKCADEAKLKVARRIKASVLRRGKGAHVAQLIRELQNAQGEKDMWRICEAIQGTMMKRDVYPVKDPNTGVHMETAVGIAQAHKANLARLGEAVPADTAASKQAVEFMREINNGRHGDVNGAIRLVRNLQGRASIKT